MPPQLPDASEPPDYCEPDGDGLDDAVRGPPLRPTPVLFSNPVPGLASGAAPGQPLPVLGGVARQDGDLGPGGRGRGKRRQERLAMQAPKPDSRRGSAADARPSPHGSGDGSERLAALHDEQRQLQSKMDQTMDRVADGQGPRKRRRPRPEGLWVTEIGEYEIFADDDESLTYMELGVPAAFEPAGRNPPANFSDAQWMVRLMDGVFWCRLEEDGRVMAGHFQPTDSGASPIATFASRKLRPGSPRHRRAGSPRRRRSHSPRRSGGGSVSPARTRSPRGTAGSPGRSRTPPGDVGEPAVHERLHHEAADRQRSRKRPDRNRNTSSAEAAREWKTGMRRKNRRAQGEWESSQLAQQRRQQGQGVDKWRAWPASRKERGPGREGPRRSPPRSRSGVRGGSPLSGEVIGDFFGSLRKSDRAHQRSPEGRQRRAKESGWRAWDKTMGKAYAEQEVIVSDMKGRRGPRTLNAEVAKDFFENFRQDPKMSQEFNRSRLARGRRASLQGSFRPGAAKMGKAYKEAPLMVEDEDKYLKRGGDRTIGGEARKDFFQGFRKEPKMEKDYQRSVLAAHRRQQGGDKWKAWQTNMGTAYEEPPLMTSQCDGHQDGPPRSRSNSEVEQQILAIRDGERRRSRSSPAAAAEEAPPAARGGSHRRSRSADHSSAVWNRLHKGRDDHARDDALRERARYEYAMTRGADHGWKPGSTPQEASLHLAGSTMGSPLQRREQRQSTAVRATTRRAEQITAKAQSRRDGEAWARLHKGREDHERDEERRQQALYEYEMTRGADEGWKPGSTPQESALCLAGSTLGSPLQRKEHRERQGPRNMRAKAEQRAAATRDGMDGQGWNWLYEHGKERQRRKSRADRGREGDDACATRSPTEVERRTEVDGRGRSHSTVGADLTFEPLPRRGGGAARRGNRSPKGVGSTRPPTGPATRKDSLDRLKGRYSPTPSPTGGKPERTNSLRVVQGKSGPDAGQIMVGGELVRVGSGDQLRQPSGSLRQQSGSLRTKSGKFVLVDRQRDAQAPPADRESRSSVTHVVPKAPEEEPRSVLLDKRVQSPVNVADPGSGRRPIAGGDGGGGGGGDDAGDAGGEAATGDEGAADGEGREGDADSTDLT